jgi:hypothetical protein
MINDQVYEFVESQMFDPCGFEEVATAVKKYDEARAKVLAYENAEPPYDYATLIKNYGNYGIKKVYHELIQEMMLAKYTLDWQVCYAEKKYNELHKDKTERQMEEHINHLFSVAKEPHYEKTKQILINQICDDVKPHSVSGKHEILRSMLTYADRFDSACKGERELEEIVKTLKQLKSLCGKHDYEIRESIRLRRYIYRTETELERQMMEKFDELQTRLAIHNLGAMCGEKNHKKISKDFAYKMEIVKPVAKMKSELKDELFKTHIKLVKNNIALFLLKVRFPNAEFNRALNVMPNYTHETFRIITATPLDMTRDVAREIKHAFKSNHR